MRILITGVCGFVGSTFARLLAEEDPEYEIWGLDNFLRAGSRLNLQPLVSKGIKVIEGDIRCSADLAKIPKVDWVIDCAAEPSVLAGTGTGMGSYELLDHNLIGTIKILEFWKTHNAGFILMSTSRVYSITRLAKIPVHCKRRAYHPTHYYPGIGLTKHGISEKFPTSPPASLYGTSKKCSEDLALEYAHTFGFPVWINRCGVLAGKGQFGKVDQGVFTFWIKSWKHQMPLKYIGYDGKGLQVRDCLHPQDLMPVIIAQLSSIKPKDPKDGMDVRICNFGGGLHNSCSLSQLSEWCGRLFGPREVGIELKLRKFDLPWIVLDSRRAKKLWGWNVKTSLEQILSEIANDE